MISNLREFRDHEAVTYISDSKTGLSGFVALHSSVLGPGVGGTRLLPYTSEEDAIADALRLSHAMSYKCALAGVPYGGAKCVLIGDPETIKTEAFLESYGVAIERLGGMIRTGVDANLSEDDVEVAARKTRYMIGLSMGGVRKLKTSDMAALGVFHAMRAALMHLFGSDDLQGKHIAVKGVGKLGSELVRLLLEEGAHVTVADTHPETIKRIAQTHDVTVCKPDEIHAVACDVYAPCALGGEFTERTLPALRTKIICGGANNQFHDHALIGEAYQKGILYVPDFIANAGGLINVVDEMDSGGYQRDRVLKRVAGIADTLLEIFGQMGDSGDPYAVAMARGDEIMSRSTD